LSKTRSNASLLLAVLKRFQDERRFRRSAFDKVNDPHAGLPTAPNYSTDAIFTVDPIAWFQFSHGSRRLYQGLGSHSP
jgi:hypothetical protein